MNEMRTLGRMRGACAVWLVAGLLALAGSALAESRQYGLVAEKDLVSKTLTLSDQVVLHVTDRTVILSPGGRRIALAEVPTATKQHGLWVLTGEGNIAYEAIQKGKKHVATRIEVLEEMPG